MTYPPPDPYAKDPNMGDPSPYGGQPAAGQPAGGPQQPPYGAPMYPTAPQYSGDPQYGAPQYGAPMFMTPSQNNLGVWAMWLGIVGLICCGPAGIAAIVMGNKSKQANSQGLANNPGQAQAGLILGWIAIALWAVGLVIGISTGSFTASFES